MSQPNSIEKGRQANYNRTKQKKSFPWLGLVLVFLVLGLIFWLIDKPDIKKTERPTDSSSFLGGADVNFKK